MMVLDSYIHKWKLSEIAKIAETPTSVVFRARYRDQIAVLKILTAVGMKSEASGARTLRHFAGRGAVNVFESDDGAWLMEFAGDVDLKSLVCAARDEEADEIACDVLDLLHANSTLAPVGLRNLQQNFRALFEAEKSDTSIEIFRVAAQEARDLLSTTTDVVVLHGDVHHKNILFDSSRGWLAIDPQGLIGERTYDVANLFFNPDDLPDIVESRARIERQSETFSRRLNVSRERVLQMAFAYGCLSFAWSIEDGNPSKRRLRISQMVFESLRKLRSRVSI
ncbi:aminoglycoside phosphotransferase family protein [soil metagenome]